MSKSNKNQWDSKKTKTHAHNARVGLKTLRFKGFNIFFLYKFAQTLRFKGALRKTITTFQKNKKNLKSCPGGWSGGGHCPYFFLFFFVFFWNFVIVFLKDAEKQKLCSFCFFLFFWNSVGFIAFCKFTYCFS